MARFFALATALIVGVVIADLVIHPQGTNTLVSGANTMEKQSLNALLGQAS